MGFCAHIAGVTCDNCRRTEIAPMPLREPREFPADSTLERIGSGRVYIDKGSDLRRAALDLLIALGDDVPERAKAAAEKLRDALAEVR